MAEEPKEAPPPEQPAKKPGGKTGKGFVKGDPRINRRGRPRGFDMFRRLAQEMGNEILSSADGSVQTTRVQMILRDWMTSKDPRKQLAFIEYAYGKVPQAVEMTGKDGSPIRYTIDIGTDESDTNPTAQGNA